MRSLGSGQAHCVCSRLNAQTGWAKATAAGTVREPLASKMKAVALYTSSTTFSAPCYGRPALRGISCSPAVSNRMVPQIRSAALQCTTLFARVLKLSRIQCVRNYCYSI